MKAKKVKECLGIVEEKIISKSMKIITIIITAMLIVLFTTILKVKII